MNNIFAYLNENKNKKTTFPSLPYFERCRWLPKTAMRPPGPDSSHNDCVLVVGVSRPKLAAVFLTVMLISLFLTFHVLYDSAVYSLQVSGQQPIVAMARVLAVLL